MTRNEIDHEAILSNVGHVLGHVSQSQGELAIRIWPETEMDELVLCLPEKKWMSIYVHRAHLAA